MKDDELQKTAASAAVQQEPDVDAPDSKPSAVNNGNSNPAASGASENVSAAAAKTDPAARPPSTTPSVGSSGSGTSAGANSSANGGGITPVKKRRTWKKPKDKPKRPLSAYNIFFKHERQRIVEGKEGSATPQEIIQSIEAILATSRETRRHRKTHGRISFSDLARRIAEKWKCIPQQQKAVFDHYAELDMKRYRRDVKIWKEKKENEAFAAAGGGFQTSNNASMNGSMSSLDNSVDSEYSFDAYQQHSASSNFFPSQPQQQQQQHLQQQAFLQQQQQQQMNFSNPILSNQQQQQQMFMQNSNSMNGMWAPRKNMYDSMNSSFSSVGSMDSELSVDPLPINSAFMMQQFQQQQQQHQQQQQQLPPNIQLQLSNHGNGMHQGSMHGSNNRNNGRMHPNHGNQPLTNSSEHSLNFADLQSSSHNNDPQPTSMPDLVSSIKQLQQQQQQLLQQQEQLRIVQEQRTQALRRQLQEQQRRQEQQQQINPDIGFDPVPFDQVFQTNTNNDLEDFLSNLDLQGNDNVNNNNNSVN